MQRYNARSCTIGKNVATALCGFGLTKENVLQLNVFCREFQLFYFNKKLTANFSSGMAKHWVGLNPNILNQLTAIVVLQESTEMPLNII